MQFNSYFFKIRSLKMGSPPDEIVKESQKNFASGGGFLPPLSLFEMKPSRSY
jgi:hypothetical protein